MLLFAAGTMNYFMVKSKLWESAVLLFAAFVLFQPGYFLNQFSPEFEQRPAVDLFVIAEQAGDEQSLRVRMTGENLNGHLIDARFLLPLEEAGADGETRLRDHAGIEFRQDAGKVFVDGLTFGGPAEQLGIDWDWEVVEIEQAADRPPKELFFIPALLLVALIYLLQMRRKTRLEQGK